MATAVYYFRTMPPDARAGHRASLEMRYSLRSLEVNAGALVDEVHVFGGRASWFADTVRHHPVRQLGGKHANTWVLWCAIARAAAVGDLGSELVLMNDDFFAAAPVAILPPYHLGSVHEFTLARRFSGAGAAAAVMELTTTALAQLGVPRGDQLAYEAHTPLPVSAAAFADVVPSLGGWFAGGQRVAKRTMLGNLAGLRPLAERLPADVKVRSNADPLPAGPWWSTSELSFSGGIVGKKLRALFPEPSRFEMDL